jgi:RNA polymerase sigma factor (sigma-70 family)
LLRRFVESRDETAFAALVRRHGPLVLGVCRRVLGHEQDAEDAFQAAFLVLAAKAGSVRRRGSVASFLHGVAERVARKARRTRARRRDRVVPLPDVAAPPSAPDFLWRELRPVLDAEIGRLPSCYREPFILCYLEGRTNAEAARRLGCPKGTVLSRLARARERLARRLRQRDITLPAAALTTLLSVETLRATVPPGLADATTRLGALSAMAKALPAGVVSAQVLSLATEGGKMMFWTKMTVVVTVVLAGSLLGLTVGANREPTAPATAAPHETPPEETAAPKPPKEKEKAETPLDAMLRKWAEADEKVREMRFNFKTTTKDNIIDEKTVVKGQASLIKDDYFRVDMQDKDGQLKGILILDGKKLHNFDYEAKTERIYAWPKDLAFGREKKETWFTPWLYGWGIYARWPLFGLQARDFTSRYDIRLVKEDRWYSYLDITPRSREDKKWFRRSRVVLNRDSYRVRQLWLEYPNRNEILTDFLDIQTNPEPPVTRDSLRKGLPKGWKRIDLTGERDADEPSRP